MGFTKLREISSERILVASNGRARLRVAGHVLGQIRVGGERRWAFGDFDETFVVEVHAARSIEITLSGLGGRLRRSIPCGPHVGIRTAAAPINLPALRARVRAPRTRHLSFHHFQGPRLLGLRKTTTSPFSERTETHP